MERKRKFQLNTEEVARLAVEGMLSAGTHPITLIVEGEKEPLICEWENFPDAADLQIEVTRKVASDLAKDLGNQKVKNVWFIATGKENSPETVNRLLVLHHNMRSGKREVMVYEIIRVGETVDLKELGVGLGKVKNAAILDALIDGFRSETR